MTQKEYIRTLLLAAAGNDPDRADKIAAYMGPLPDGETDYADTATVPDGIYLATPAGPKPYRPGTVTRKDAETCTGVGVKLGSKSLTVALRDCCNGQDITLTAGKDNTDWDGYKDSYADAVADWDGKGNTDHLKAVGLNPGIYLEPGQYIPSMGELRFVHLFRKEINEALAELRAQCLEWGYWTSTEYSANSAWYLSLSNGTQNTYTKASDKFRVRAVSAFIS